MDSVSPTIRGSRIFVGLSGGVDSAVTAALLKQHGADVVGVFVKGWYPPGMPCTWAEDRRDAMRVAAHLQIPFVTLDASKEYKEGVMDYLLREYRAGRTPNPDIMCNREVKFGALFDYARSHGADFLATGHYAQTVHPHDNTGTQMLRGVDADKDQSYFLWAVPQEVLSHTLFPLGGMRKPAVRELAKRFKLPVAAKRDSQGICFLGSISVDDFLRHEFAGDAAAQPGKAVDTSGATIGQHDGALLHTLGERIGLTDAAPGPWYVVQKNIEKNELTVSHTRVTASSSHAIRLSQTNWLVQADPHAIYEAQYRYHGPRISGTLNMQLNTFTPMAALPEPCALGQSLVVYDGESCVGGGIIEGA